MPFFGREPVAGVKEQDTMESRPSFSDLRQDESAPHQSQKARGYILAFRSRQHGVAEISAQF